MSYWSEKQRDGTYVIYGSKVQAHFGREIIKSNVRGCNVNRIINRLYWEDMYGDS